MGQLKNGGLSLLKSKGENIMKCRMLIPWLICMGSFIFISYTTSSLSLAQEYTTLQYLPVVLNNYSSFETGKIVFVSYRDGNCEIYRMNYDGSELTRLTNDSSNDSSPDWSPDGSKIAFQSNRSGEYEIYVMNADGTNPSQVTTMTHSYSPKWSPDGTRIAFYTRPASDNIIYSMNPDGSGLVQLTDPSVSAYDPHWSPDGLRIAYQSARVIPLGIYTIDVNGANPTLLYGSTGIAYFAWSPDGKRLALSISSAPNFNMDIYVYDLFSFTLTR